MNPGRGHRAEKSALYFLSTEPYIPGSQARPPLVPIPVRCSELAHPLYARSDSQQWFAGAGFGLLNGQALSGGVREGKWGNVEGLFPAGVAAVFY
jgi:hypothetical protein